MQRYKGIYSPEAVIRFSLITVIFIASCSGEKKEKIPGDVIPEKEMTQLLTDLHLVEGYISSGFARDSADQKLLNYYHTVFKKYGVTEEQFQKSFEFYLRHPKLLDGVYQDVLEEMSKEEAEAAKK